MCVKRWKRGVDTHDPRGERERRVKGNVLKSLKEIIDENEAKLSA